MCLKLSPKGRSDTLGELDDGSIRVSMPRIRRLCDKTISIAAVDAALPRQQERIESCLRLVLVVSIQNLYSA